MSEFTSPLVGEFLESEDIDFKLTQEFVYHIGEYPSTDVIVVPVGSRTDFASTPRFMWAILPPFGRYGKAAVLHDYLYRNGLRTRREADLIFFEAMGVLEVPLWKRRAMLTAVRLFGRSSYKG